MFPLRLVFLAISISMILTSTVFGGSESQNDRMDTLLSLMTGMRDRMDNMEKNVGNIEENIKTINKMDDLTAEKVSKIEDEMVEMIKRTNATDSKISSMQSKISATDSKINRIKSDVSSTKSMVSRIGSEVEDVQKNVGWTFVGMGEWKTRDESIVVGYGYSLARCLAVCTNKRSSNYMWNGVRFGPSNGYCECVKNDKGHSPYEGHMHFRG